MPKSVHGFQKGHIVPEHVRQRVIESQTGRKQSEETKLKKSIAMTGKKLPPMSDERKKQMRLVHLGRKQSAETIAKRVVARKNYKHSQITKNKIGKANRKKIHKTDESVIWRKRVEFKLWRESVYTRDNWTCQKCKIRGKLLHPHHIKNFAEAIELRFDIDNGITLCQDCHKQFHKTYGQRNNNKDQITQFIKSIECN